jgi:glycosyltransferase involved in cell wall biosynthesis
MKRAPITAALIVRDDPQIVEAIRSVRDYVAEVAVVYTGYDGLQAEYLRSLANRFAVCTECNDARGEMVDFSVARNASFALATQPWTMWLDSDDRIRGAEYLDEILGCAHDAKRPRLLARYDYDHDAMGRVTVSHWRERIVRRDSGYVWKYPVHEVLVASDGYAGEDLRIQQPIVWEHQRRETDKSGRNLRILRHLAESHDVTGDAWWQYNMGRELRAAGEVDEAAVRLRRYLELSNVTDERALAMLTLADVEASRTGLTDPDASIAILRAALEESPGRFDVQYSLAKYHYMRALLRGDDSDLARTVEWCKSAAATEPTESPRQQAPQDRAYDVHKLRCEASEALGDWKDALESARSALAARPNDGPMRLASRRYENKLDLDAASHVTQTSGLDIVIACGQTNESWNPELAEKNGIGGSETAVIEMAKRLVKLGHRVRVWTSCPSDGEWDGVEYTYHLENVTQCDVLVAWRKAPLLEPFAARLKWLWVHDVGAHEADSYNLSLAEKVLVLSDWHKAEVLSRHGSQGLREEQIVVTRNGIEPARFHATGQIRNPHRAIYSSSADRGLKQLLAMWPKVRAFVPDAELRIFYSRLPPELEVAAEQSGVSSFGRINQRRLTEELLSAGVWVHPSWLPDGRRWTETSCIAAIEAMAAGCRCVMTPHGALPETAFGETFVAGEDCGEEWEALFVGAIADAMLLPELSNERQTRSLRTCQEYDWQPVAEQWDRMMREALGVRRAA